MRRYVRSSNVTEGSERSFCPYCNRAANYFGIFECNCAVMAIQDISKRVRKLDLKAKPKVSKPVVKKKARKKSKLREVLPYTQIEVKIIQALQFQRSKPAKLSQELGMSPQNVSYYLKHLSSPRKGSIVRKACHGLYELNDRREGR